MFHARVVKNVSTSCQIIAACLCSVRSESVFYLLSIRKEISCGPAEVSKSLTVALAGK